MRRWRRRRLRTESGAILPIRHQTVKLRRAVIAGLGLIGGSFAGALRRNGLCEEVLGWVRRPEPLEIAKRRGLVSGGGMDLAELAEGADLVFIATPLEALEQALEYLRPLVGAKTVISDGVSVKQEVLRCAHQVFGGLPENFVGGHPIAGSERSGVEAADPELFRNRKTVLTPTAETSRRALELMRGLWEGVGARVLEMSAAQHDEGLAATSHLPHLLAYAAMHLLDEEGGEELLRLAGSGLEDFSRIAQADPGLWRGISLANAGTLQKLLERYSDTLRTMGRHLQNQDGEALQAMFHRARELRLLLGQKRND